MGCWANAEGMSKRLLICGTCEGNGAALAQAVRSRLGTDWSVEMQECLSVCQEPVAMGVQATGKASYVFAGLSEADAADVAGFVRLYDADSDGWIADARPAGRLRFCLKARLPAL